MRIIGNCEIVFAKRQISVPAIKKQSWIARVKFDYFAMIGNSLDIFLLPPVEYPPVVVSTCIARAYLYEVAIFPYSEIRLPSISIN